MARKSKQSATKPDDANDAKKKPTPAERARRIIGETTDGNPPSTGRPVSKKGVKQGGIMPPSVTEEMKPEIIEMFAQGMTWRVVCREMKLHLTALRRALRSDPDFMQAYNDAKQQATDFMVDEIYDMAQDVYDNKDAQNAAQMASATRVAMEGIKITIEKRAPRAYGNLVKLGGDEEMPLTIDVVNYAAAAKPAIDHAGAQDAEEVATDDSTGGK